MHVLVLLVDALTYLVYFCWNSGIVLLFRETQFVQVFFTGNRGLNYTGMSREGNTEKVGKH